MGATFPGGGLTLDQDKCKSCQTTSYIIKPICLFMSRFQVLVVIRFFSPELVSQFSSGRTLQPSSIQKMQPNMLLPIILSLASSAIAIDFSKWAPPGPNDVRSPCPGLNSLANHNIIPHSGKGLTVKILTDAMEQTFNIGFDLRTILAVGGVFASPTALQNGKMNLDDLDKHNFIEHDGSLSRAPIHSGGDDHTFRQDIFDTVLSFFSNDTDATTSIDEASAAHLHRVKTDSQTPDFTYASKQTFLALGETALYLMALGDASTGVGPLEYLKIMFEQERLPYNEGWRTSQESIYLGNTLEMMNKLGKANGEISSESQITNATLARALVGLDDATGDIPPFVKNLLDHFGLGGLVDN